MAHVTRQCSLRQSAFLTANSSQFMRVSDVQRGGRRLGLCISAAQVSSNDFKTGMSIEMDGQPYKVVEFLHVKPGKGAAFVRSKLKNFLTGNSVEKTWRAGETVELASTRIPEDESWSKYLKEGMDVQVLTWNGKVISVDLPNTVDWRLLKLIQE
eukprot:jgi/Picre1/32685/NNA_008030.t1